MKEMLESKYSEILLVDLASDKIRAKIVKEGHTVKTKLSYGDS